jgi:putative nucleotidyltransferase with HDIG domain
LAVAACPDNCDPDLLWIALLHDSGKPATTRQDGAGRITAHGHARLGADMAAEILARLDMPEQRRRRIVWAIRHHMFHHSWQLQDPAKLTKRQRAHLVNPDFPLLLEFLRIDSATSHGSNDGTKMYAFYWQLWAEVSGVQQQ